MTPEDKLFPNAPKAEVLFGGRQWVLRTTLEALSQADDAFEERIARTGFSKEDKDKMALAVHEALINAIAHGNLGIIKPDNSEKNLGELIREELENHPEKKDKKVIMVIDEDVVAFYVKITDEGKGFRPAEVADPRSAQGQKKTKGRGLLMMEEYFDKVEHIDDGRTVILTKYQNPKDVL